MAYDEALAARVRRAIGRRGGVAEKEMFGGLAFLVGGKLAVCVRGGELMARVGPEAEPALLRKPGARRFDHKGRAMAGWLLVAPEGTRTDAALKAWVKRGLAHAASLPDQR